MGGARTPFLREHAPIVSGLARLAPVEVVETLAERPKAALPLVAGGFEAYLPAAELFDVAAERQRLAAEVASVERAIAHSAGLLARPGFAEKAPGHVVAAEREKLAANQDRLARLRAQLEALGD